MTKGQQAMALAMMFPDGGAGGRGRKGNPAESVGFGATRLRQARSVLRLSKKYEASKIPQAVMAGDMGLDEALESVRAIENQASSAEAHVLRHFPMKQVCDAFLVGFCAWAH